MNTNQLSIDLFKALTYLHNNDQILDQRLDFYRWWIVVSFVVALAALAGVLVLLQRDKRN